MNDNILNNNTFFENSTNYVDDMFQGGSVGNTTSGFLDDGNNDPPMGLPRGPPPGPPSFTDYQRKWLAYGPKVPALLSILGSMWILYDLLSRHRSKQNTNNNRQNRSLSSTYPRILFMMSSIDILSSFWYFLGTWAATEEDAVKHGLPPLLFGSDKGNQATCSAQGFFMQLGLAAPLYNVSQALYSLLVVRYGWKEHQIQARNAKGNIFSSVSSWFLGAPFIFALATAIVGLPLELYNLNPATFMCWYSPYPAHCDPLFGAEAPPGDCLRGTNANKFRFAFGFVPLWVSLLIMIGAMIMVAEKVYSLEKRAQKWKFQSKAKSYTQEIPAVHNDKLIRSKPESSKLQAEDSTSTTNHSDDLAHVSTDNEATTNINSSSDGLVAEQSHSPPEAGTPAKTSIKSSILSKFEREEGQSLEKTRKVVVQAICFVGAFLISWTCSMIYQFAFMDAVADNGKGIINNFPFILVSGMLLPLQGFLNALVVLRPRYVHNREVHSNWSRWKALVEALFEGGGV